MKYTVILKVEETDPCFALYSRFSEIISEAGQKLLHVECNKRPESDGSFLEMTMAEPEEKEGVTIRVPLHYVALIGNDWAIQQMGFKK